MPVTFRVAQHAPQPISHRYTSSKDIIASACTHQFKRMDKLLQSSVDPVDYPATRLQANGFVGTVIEAYNQHHNLAIRPDDVWIAILAQFQSYVNANAEELRGQFVSHQDKRKLTIVASGTRYTIDLGDLAIQMTQLIHEKVIDKDLVQWILPSFSTTTTTDTAICAVLLMATSKQSFSYKFDTLSGIPYVTLLGDHDDWVDLLSRIEVFETFGDEPRAFAQLLQPILTRFISAFTNPASESNVDFWSRIVYHHDFGSGGPCLSGWISAFCVWDNDGKWQGPKVEGGIEEPWSPPLTRPTFGLDEPTDIVLDDIQYPSIPLGNIPAGFACVDVTMHDSGEQFDCEMAAGHVGTHVLPDEGDTTQTMEDAKSGRTIQPASAWFIYTKSATEATTENGDSADDVQLEEKV